MLARFWSRMNFVARLALSAGGALAIASVALLYTSTEKDAEFYRAELGEQVEAELDSLLPALSDQVVIGDYAIIYQTLAARAKRSNIASVTWTDREGAEVRAEENSSTLGAPQWFTGWVDISAPLVSHELSIGGRFYGTVTVALSAIPSVNRLWSSFAGHVLILVLAVGLNLAGIIVILRTGLRPLGALAAGAEALGNGDLATRIPVLGSPEIRRAISAFNDMAGDIEGLMASLSEHRRVIENSAILVETSLEGAITFVADSFCKISGYSRAELVGKTHRLVSSRHHDEAFYRNLWKTISAGRIWRGEIRNVSKDGRPFWLHTVITPFAGSDGRLEKYVAIAFDITARKEQEERLRRRDAWLSEYVVIASSHAGTEERIDKLLALGCKHLGMEFGCISRLDSDRFVIERVVPPGAVPFDGTTPYDGSLCRVVLQSGQAVYFASRAQAPANAVPLLPEIESWVGHPIAVDGALTAVLHFASSRPGRQFDADDLGFVRLAANWIGMSYTLEQNEMAIHREKELAQVTLQSIGDAVVTTDGEGAVTYLNPVAEDLTGWSVAEAQGLPLAEVFRIVNEYSRQPLENPVAKVLREGCIVGLANHTLLISRDGREFVIEDSAAPIRDRNSQTLGVVMVFHDVSEKREMEREMTWQASHDPLTGLANRREFERRLEGLQEVARLRGVTHYLLYMDLDQFKVVNDTCGHAAGDELLRHIAALLLENVRTSDTLARLGGDEFGVLLENCGEEKAREIAERMIATIRDFRFVWADKAFVLGASVGMTAITRSTLDLQGALSGADTACYLAKEKGRNQVQIYTESDAEVSLRHGEMQWVSRIATGLERDDFALFYQLIAPVLDDPSARKHRELLIRMKGPDGSWILPGAFIPAAERFGLMMAIDQWVIRAAFAAFRRWMELGGDWRAEIWAINVSGASLGRKDFHQFVADELKRQAIPPEAICFEVTETAAIANLAHAMSFIRSMKALGCRFALDDFGSGMSSFTYLKNLPVDYLKIDGAFVKDIGTDHSDLAIVESIIRIGHAFGLETIAEFVESERIVEALRDLGIDYLQGFAIHRPAPLDDELQRITPGKGEEDETHLAASGAVVRSLGPAPAG